MIGDKNVCEVYEIKTAFLLVFIFYKDKKNKSLHITCY